MVLRTTMMTISLLASYAYAEVPNNTFLFNPTAQRMSTDDLNRFQYDCDHVGEQRAFLKSQLKQISRYDANNIDRAIILNILANMESCPTETKEAKVGCVHVREDMQSGSANVTICNSNPHGLSNSDRPIINHWDPLVDMK
jgi:hypothetical protein